MSENKKKYSITRDDYNKIVALDNEEKIKHIIKLRSKCDDLMKKNSEVEEENGILLQMSADGGEVIESLKKENESLKYELAELINKQKYNEEYIQKEIERLNITNKRKQSDFELSTIQKTVDKIIPSIDNLQRALSTPTSDINFHKGVEMTYKMLVADLESIGVFQIKALGFEFNPHLHEAIEEIEQAGIVKGIVIEELTTGYKYKDKLIRPSIVKVSK